MDLEHRQVVLILPFEHRLGGDERSEALRLLGETWRPWWRRLATDQLRDALDNGCYFLPHVRELLFPEAAMVEAPSMDRQLRAVDELLEDGLDLEELAAKVPSDAVLHLALNRANLAELRSLRVRAPARVGSSGELPERAWEIELGWVDVLAWPQGVGFLLLSVQPRDDRIPLDDWRSFLEQIRLVHPPTPSWVMPRWETKEGLAFEARDLVDYLLEGWTEGGHGAVWSSLGEFLDHRAEAGCTGYSTGRFGQVYGAAFRLFCYGVAVEEERPADNASDLFDSPMEEALYQLGTGYSTATDTGLPHPRRVREMREKDLVALWDNWQAMVSGHRVVFLGTRSTKFTRQVLPQNILGQYLYLYLLTLFQKVRLSLLSGEILRRGWDIAHHRREARRLWEDFSRFRNLYWYSEMTLSPQGKELFRAFQRGLDLPPLYEEMKEEVRETHRYYQGYYERRFNRLLNVLTFVGLPASLWVSLFAGALIGEPQEQLTGSWAVAGWTAIGLYLVVLLTWLYWRNRRK